MRPESVYETRARELASAAGLDPEARIPNPAKPGKTMPPGARSATPRAPSTWRARNAEVAADRCRRRRRSSRTARSKIFGQHDEATIAQMRNCMARRQRRRRRDLRRRPSRLRAAGRRRDRLREADQHLRRRLRHRLRQHGGAPRYAVRRDRRAASARSSRTCARDLVRRRPHQRRARRA